MGDGESAATERPFQSMNAVERIRAKLRICEASCRGAREVRDEIMVVVRLVGGCVGGGLGSACLVGIEGAGRRCVDSWAVGRLRRLGSWK